MMAKARTIMLQGVASDVGKSVLVAGLCRILAQDGYKVAPFKAQNMALNSSVTKTGGEIGRAQAVQAEAACVEPTVDMNPILLKPVSDTVAQVVIHGQPIGNLSAGEYMRFKSEAGWRAVRESLRRLEEAYDVIVIEGAGSPAEINLREGDIVNMSVAIESSSPVILIGDIDRGGVFAYLVGTLELLPPSERELVKGIIINKFRGRKELLWPGIEMLSRMVGVPVLGIVPYFNDLGLPEEDSLPLERPLSGREPRRREIEIAVLSLPHISNFTDFDPLEREPGVRLHYVLRREHLGNPDAIIIPGTKNTIGDLLYLEEVGWLQALKALAIAGTPVIGVCGGYQMLGREIRDPLGVESNSEMALGLGLLDMTTEFGAEKVTQEVEALVAADRGPFAGLAGERISGYEIHMGNSRLGSEVEPLFRIVRRSKREVSLPDGAISQSGLVFGTYLHGIFENDRLRRHFIDWLRSRKGLGPVDAATTCVRAERERAYDRLASRLRESLDMEALYRIIRLR